MTAQIIMFVPKPNPNRDAIDRVVGVPANVEGQNVEVAGNLGLFGAPIYASADLVVPNDYDPRK